MKIYAVVTPVFSSISSVDTGTFEIGINFFHACRDEKVCGYSLNKPITFLNTDEEMLSKLSDITTYALIPTRTADREMEKAIVELIVENNQIQQFINIRKIENREWVTQKITVSDLTPNALEQINIQYQNYLKLYSDVSLQSNQYNSVVPR
jgi:hypothetical protein